MQNRPIKANNMKVPGLIIKENEWNEFKKLATTENEYHESEPNLKLKQLLIEAKKNEIQYQAEKPKTGHTQLKKILDDIEAENQKRDKIRIQENLENRNKVIENMRLNIWSNKDSTKMIKTEENKMQVLKERALQIEFNNAERMKAQEAERLLKIEQIAEVEKYKKDLLEEKQRLAEMKKANNAIFLNELKFREDLKRDEAFKLKNEGVASIKRLKQEIENDKKEEEAKIQAKRKRMEYNLSENRKIVAMNSELQQLREEKQNKSIEISNETKKIMNRLLKLKEIKLRKERQQLLDKLSEKGRKDLGEMSKKLKTADQNVDEKTERKYQERKLKEEELANKTRKLSEDNKKTFEEANQKEKERSKLSRQWELERWQRENKILSELKQSHKRAKINDMNNYRKTLNDQCATKQAIILANQQAEHKDFDASVKLWHQDEAEFMNYAKNLVEKYAKDGVTVTPFLKAIQAYTANSRL